ncbi:MAG: aminoacyl--tRNA ligase-related protein [Nitrososphaerota archaeon]
MELRIELEGYLELTTEVNSIASQVSELIREVNERFRESIQIKEAAEAAIIVEYGGEGRRLRVKIISGGRLRAHDAFLRLKNLLVEKLGQSMKVGVREVFVDKLVVKISGEHVNRQSAEEKLKGVAEISVEDNTLVLIFRNLSDHDIRDRIVDRAIRLVREKEKVVEEAEKLAPFGTLLRKGVEKTFLFDGEISAEAERLGWAKRYPGRGQWIFTGPMTALLRTLSELIIDYVAKPLGFQEWMFPRLMPFDVFRRLSTYVEHLPEGLFYVCAPPRDPSAFEEFKREYMLRRELRKDLLKNILEEPGYVLEAVQCPPFYQYFSEEIVRLEDLPIKVFDVLGGWTWRNEAGGVEGIVRTNEFWRMEMVFLASPEEIIEIRNKVTELSIELIDKILDMEWRLVAGAPFFLSPEEASKRLIDVSSLDKIPTLDIEVYLPYRGARDKAEWLEITAATVHRDYYVKAFKIKEAKNREIWTGCVGHGLTRWAAGVLARHGFNFDSWPKEVKSRIKELPQPPRTVT